MITRLQLYWLLAAATFWGCGKVADLSDQAGIADPAYVSIELSGGALLPATVNLPYKDLPKITGGKLPFQFALAKGELLSGLSLDLETGVISGMVSDVDAGKESAFSLAVTDGAGITDTKNFTIKVNAYTFEVSPAELPAIVPRQPYAVTLSTIGAIEPVHYEVVGNLPTGVSFDAEKALIGATDAAVLLDTETSDVSVTIKVTDANQVEVTKTYPVRVTKGDYVPPSFVSRDDAIAIPVDREFRDVLEVSGGVGPFTYSVSKGELPEGLELVADSGVITGTVPAAKVATPRGTFAVEVVDGYGLKDEETFVYELAPYAITVTPLEIPEIIPTVPFSMKFAAVGAAGEVKYEISGSLPQHLEFSEDGTLATGASGVDAGDALSEWPIVVAATDANGVTGKATLKVVVGAKPANSSPLTIQTTALNPMLAGSAYSTGISTTGGVAPLAYELQSGTLPTGLSLNTTTGVISGNLGFGVAGSSYAVVVQVTDANGAVAAKTYSGSVGIGSNALTIRSSIVSTPIAGGEYSSVIAVTGGELPYTFSVQSGTLPSGLTINATTGVIAGTVATTAANQTYLFTVAVADSAGQSVSRAYSGTIGSVSSPLAIQTSSLVNPVAGTTYSAGITVSGGVTPHTFAISSGALPSGLSLSTTTGLITGTVPSGAAGGAFAVEIRVTDAAGQTASRSYTGSIISGSAALTIASSSLATPTAGVSYAAVVGTTGGITPYTYSVATGSLPLGLTLDANTGLISGTPTYASAGVRYDFRIAVTDATTLSVNRDYSLLVNPISPAMSVVTSSLIAPVSGAAYSAGITVSNGVAPLTFAISSGSLPSGLTLNTSTGVISGTLPYASAGASYVVTIGVTDAAGQTASKTYSGSVTNGTTALTGMPTSIATPAAGAAYVAVISATGGVMPYTWSITNGSLPTGLSLSTTTGVISGTPTYATSGVAYAFEVTITDSSSQTAAKTYSGSVSSVATLAISTSTITAPTAGSAYQATIAATGGVAPYSFAVTSGALPPGLSLSTTGVLSGTSTSASRTSAYSFGITVTDSNASTAQQSYSGIVSDYAVSLVPTSLTPPVPGAYYAGAVTAIGGQTPYTYSVTSGTLPSGLSLNSSTGAVTGTVADAEAGQNRAVTIGVVDANGATVSRSYTISTVSFAVSVTTTSLNDAIEGSAYTNSATALAATGGTGPYTYQYTGTLPAGVGLTAAGGFFGTPASGQGAVGAGTTYPIQVRVRDSTNALSAAVGLNLVVRVVQPSMTAGNLATAVLGMPYSNTVTAAGGRPPYTYAVVGSLPAGLSLSSGGVISGTATAAATCPTNQFAIVASDSLSQSSSTSVYQCIPTSAGISVTNAALATAYEGQSYTNGATALAATGGTAPYTYSYTGSLPSGVGLSPSGDFFGAPIAGQGSVAGIDYVIQVQAKDATNAVSLPKSLTLNVRVSAPVVSASAAASAVLGTPYSHTIAASGGRAPYSFALSSGSLPSGLSLSSGGVVSGTPTGSSSCPTNQFNVIATDALGQVSAAATKCIATGNGLNITNASFPTVVIGTNYNSTVAVTGGTTPYAFSGSSLPSGITINASTGVLSGFTNETAGDYTGFILVTDSSATPLTTTRSVVFHVRDALALPATTPPRAAAAPGAGIAYDGFSAAATGGLAPVTHAVTAGSLPPGLSLSAAGSITGTPTYDAAVAGSYAFTITATDAADATASRAYTIHVTVAPRIATRSLEPAVVGVPYAMHMSRVGGVNSFIGAGNIASQLSWSATGLPTGLSINSSSGRITGTPSGAPGNYSVNVSVADAYGFTATKTLTLKLASAGKTLELGAARFSEPCLSNATNCDPRGYDVGKLTNNVQQFAVYGRNDVKSIQIAKIDATGRIPVPGTSVLTSNVALPTGFGTITNVRLADLDQDGYLDIAFVENTGQRVCALWGGSGVDVNGMPTAYSTTNLDCWIVPNGMHASNTPYTMMISNSLRPDSTNYGKQDIIVTASQNGGTGNTVFTLLNTCPLAGACTSAAARATLFQGYVAPTGDLNSSTSITNVSSTTGVAVGMQIVAPGIPAGATVTAKTANTITLSAAATLTQTGVKLSTPSALTMTGTSTNGSNVITSVSSTAGIKIGQSIKGTNIAADAVVTAFTANTITMSVNATGANSGLTVYGPSAFTPYILAASVRMIYLFNVGVGNFDAPAPNPPSTYATSQSTCPSIVVVGNQQNSNASSWIYIQRQTYSGGQCQGDFSLHGVDDEPASAITGTPWADALAVTDFNGDGISDIVVGLGAQLANSNTIRTYLMPGGATFNLGTIITSQMQSVGTQYVGASKVMPYCLDGSTSCAYPSLLATCDREYAIGRVSGYACMAIFPNDCSTPGCLTPFESGVPSQRIDYPAPYGQNREPVAAPIVSPGNLSITGTTTSGSATISSVSSTSGIAVGQTISGTGIPATAYVTAIGAGTLTISQNATASGSGVVLTLPQIPTRNDIVMMGVDTTSTEPFFLTFARNGANTTDPFKSSRMLDGFPASYFAATEIGTTKLADLNSDGELDLVAYLVNQGQVSTYLSAPSGSPVFSLGANVDPAYLANPTYLGCPTGFTSCLPDPLTNTMGAMHGYPAAWHAQNTLDVGDLNNDGIPDLVVTGYSTRGVAVALTSASGEPDVAVLYDLGTYADIKPQAVTISDLDQDGVQDILAASYNATGATAHISWLRGRGDGSFEDAQQISGIVSTCNDPRAIAAPDLDGDGRPEIAVLCYNNNPQAIWIARRHTNGNWVAQSGGTINASGGANGTFMRWGRLTSTTGIDVVVGGLDVTNSMRIINGVSLSVTNPTTGAFTLSSSPGAYMSLSGYPSDVDIADLNADGYGDVVVGMQTQNGGTGQNGEIYYTCQSTVAGQCSLKGWGMEGYQTSSITLGDVNADGLADLFVGYKSNSVGIQRLIYRTLGRTLNTSH